MTVRFRSYCMTGVHCVIKGHSKAPIQSSSAIYCTCISLSLSAMFIAYSAVSDFVSSKNQH